MHNILSNHSHFESSMAGSDLCRRHLVQHALHAAGRSAWLAAEFALATVGWLASAWGGRGDAAWRARWLQRHARRVLRVFDCRLTFHGTLPERGYLVANHLSYLDILVLAACRPCVFVAKREVRGWPVVGWFGRLAGTVFVDRCSCLDSARAVGAMRQAGAEGALVVLFPEGTSSNGREVLPFKSSLLEPLVSDEVCGVVHLRYRMSAGSAEDEVCYWRDMTLVPHLWNLLGKPGVKAELRAGMAAARGIPRKVLAVRLRHAIRALGSAPAPKNLPGSTQHLTGRDYRGGSDSTAESFAGLTKASGEWI
jgi:1-acyl-sn-glycerol-3-phosphate acyltransferase